MSDALKAEVFDQRLEVQSGKFYFQGREIPCHNEILRFSPDHSYSTGNFSKLRERHATLQLDSINGTQDRYNTLLERTAWPAGFFKGKLTLECGCGAGADTEALLQLGARVVSADITGVDICRKNIGPNPDSLIVQASIDDLPFKKKTFDIVWCHRVLQHTPAPSRVLSHILSFVKDGGAVFVHSYARSVSQMFRWKYALRPITRRMDPERLYGIIKAFTPALLQFTSSLRRIPPDILGRFLFRLADRVVPVRNYRFSPPFAKKSDAFLVEYAVHDTFDCLSPRYDSPLSAQDFRAIAGKYLKKEYEVVKRPDVTLLRTVVPGSREKI
jgi:2-polyprenyl-3-methyl-5-hydroxy-6-metoxy-1,4-benzoquinol methylase